MAILTFYDNFRRRIGRLLEGRFTDAILLVEGVEIAVHKCILAIQSEYFSDLFGPREDSRQTADQRDASSSSLALIEVEEISNSNHQAIVEATNNLSSVADNIFELKNAKVEVVRAVLEYFYRGEYDYDDKESLLSLLDEESFAALEIDIFRAAERWAWVNKPNIETVKDIVKKIRLATMSQEDLIDVVEVSKELLSIDIREPVRSIIKKDAASTNFRQPPTLVAGLNVAQSSLGAEVLSGGVTGADLISGSSGSTSHKVGGNPDCIAVKLGKTYHLNALQLLLDSSEERSYKYHVEVSVDGKNWLRVVDHSNYWCRSHQFLRFDPRAVRFIRMTGTDESLNIISFAALYSNEEYSLVQGIQVAATNVVLESRGATVTGGFSGNAFSNPMYCIDGKEDSSVLVNEHCPLTIKLGQPHWLSSLRVRIKANGTSYTIESSTDGESWQPVYGETEGERDTVWRTFEFSHRVVLHFRVTMKIRGHYDRICLFHFESPARTTAVTN